MEPSTQSPLFPPESCSPICCILFPALTPMAHQALLTVFFKLAQTLSSRGLDAKWSALGMANNPFLYSNILCLLFMFSVTNTWDQ